MNETVIFILIKYLALLINNLRIRISRRLSALRTRREIKNVLKKKLLLLIYFLFYKS